ncbi:MAG: hypothetical protein ACK5O2_02285 [Microthrixaceae bacterium]
MWRPGPARTGHDDMTIRRGEDWGARGPLAKGAPLVRTDAEVVPAIDRQRIGDPPEVGLLGGDLHRTLGSPVHSEAELRSGEAMRLPIDLVEVILHTPDGQTIEERFCAHLVATAGDGRLFETQTYVAMNGSFIADANVGPRAHPNDGLVDITSGVLARRDRRAARRRLSTGTHLPHPDLDTARVRSDSVSFDRVRRVSLDGREPFDAVGLALECIPDALVVVA